MIKMMRKLEMKKVMTKVMKMISSTFVVYLEMLPKKLFPRLTFANSSATSTCQDTGVTRAP